MKLFLLSAFIFTVVSAAAAPRFYELDEGDRFLSTISSVVSVEKGPLCPEGALCLINGTQLNVELPLGGCLDRLGPVTYTLERKENKTIVNIMAIRIINEESNVAFCVREPSAFVGITLINTFGPIEVKMLNSL
jgi:hypothetical protein